MTPTQINDLAFGFVEDNFLFLLNQKETEKIEDSAALTIKKYFLNAGGTLEELDFFLVFLKHWLDNKISTQWSSIIMDISFSYHNGY